MEIRVKTIEEIKDIIQKENKENAQILAIPDIIDFPFPELYKKIVTKYNTINISSYCGLYSFSHAIDITEKYYNNNWIKGNNIKDYWFIGEGFASGYDYWIMDKYGKIYYWESDGYRLEYSLENKINVNINFEKWLQFAYLNNDVDKILEKEYNGDIDKEKYKTLNNKNLNKYENIIREISKEFYEIVIG